LVVGRWPLVVRSLVVGRSSFVVRRSFVRWSLVVGRWSLVVGRSSFVVRRSSSFVVTWPRVPDAGPFRVRVITDFTSCNYTLHSCNSRLNPVIFHTFCVIAHIFLHPPRTEQSSVLGGARRVPVQCATARALDRSASRSAKFSTSTASAEILWHTV